MIVLLTIAALQTAPATLSDRRCELVTPRGEAVRFDVVSAAVGSNAVTLLPVDGAAWPRVAVGGRATRPRPAGRTYALGPNDGGLFARFGEERPSGGMEATLFLGDRVPSLPVAHGLCVAGSEPARPAPAAPAAPAASLEAAAASALDPRRWPASDGCRLLTADRRRLSLTYFAPDSRTVRIAVPGFGIAEQTIPRRASLARNGVSRGRFGTGTASRGTDTTYVHGAYAARLFAFEAGPAAGSVGICGLGGIVRVLAR